VAVECALTRATARVEDAIRALESARRVDLSGLPPSAAALLLARLAQKTSRKILVLTPDTDSARRAVSDLELFGGVRDSDGESAGEVLSYPAHAIRPFVEVAPDRRAAVDRLAPPLPLAPALPRP